MSGGFVSINTSAHEIASMGGQLSGIGTEFSGQAAAAKAEHAKLATLDTFGNDRMGEGFFAKYGENDNPEKVLKAQGTLGDQLAEIGGMVKKAAMTQYEGELENLKMVNDVQT
ncbi:MULTISPECIES: hypothetical protein [Amycolatopsis]|uniref:Uncharacterized protein n=1 Tax=Amycolatopsis tucumanensis TaxID=401106 RepID=A0ABP7JD74_9PSEU|nr:MULTISPECIES: hypothetical protein [Amycolatopsis]MCF6423845.1 hypothetical protein [Amycolatopsis tucumanensis]